MSLRPCLRIIADAAELNGAVVGVGLARNRDFRCRTAGYHQCVSLAIHKSNVVWRQKFSSPRLVVRIMTKLHVDLVTDNYSTVSDCGIAEQVHRGSPSRKRLPQNVVCVQALRVASRDYTQVEAIIARPSRPPARRKARTTGRACRAGSESAPRARAAVRWCARSTRRRSSIARVCESFRGATREAV